MRKCLTVLLACGLVLLCACSKTPKATDQPQDTITGNYKAAVAAIDSGDYRTAYDLLTDADDEQSKELLSHFVFVPTTITNQSPDNATVFSSVTLRYDEKGNLLKHTFDNHTEIVETAYTYDTDGRMVKETYMADDVTYTTAYTYDTDGKLSAKHYASDAGSEIQYTYTYDENGNLTEEKSVSSSGEETTLTYQYNDAGKETLYRSDTKNGSWTAVETAYYDNGNVHTVTHRRPYNGKTYVYEYDEQGRLWREWDTSKQGELVIYVEHTYDEADHLLQSHYPNTGGTVKYVYNAQGQLVETLDGAHHIVYTYDENGNLLTETRTVSETFNREKRYAYDTHNRVTKEEITYANNKSETTLFVYDAYGNVVNRNYTGFTVETQSDRAVDVNVTWTVFYYPNGVPEAVQTELNKLAQPLTTIEAS